MSHPWYLSSPSDTNMCASVPGDLMPELQNYHIRAVEFMFHALRQGLTGVILNMEHDMNSPLAVCAFLRAMLRDGWILVMCPDEYIGTWYYHLVQHCLVTVKLVQNIQEVEQLQAALDRCALIVTTSTMYMLKEMIDIDFYAFIVHDLDLVATIKSFKILSGSFNVGLTCRNFYEEADAKLLWFMLNWANPGSVGRLKEFYELNEKHRKAHVDAYSRWWLRLTWSYCDTFKKPTAIEMQIYQDGFYAWCAQNNCKHLYNTLMTQTTTQQIIERRGPRLIRKQRKMTTNEKVSLSDRPIVVEVPQVIDHQTLPKNSTSDDSSSSSDTSTKTVDIAEMATQQIISETPDQYCTSSVDAERVSQSEVCSDATYDSLDCDDFLRALVKGKNSQSAPM